MNEEAESILVVDDEQSITDFVSYSLMKEGFKVDVASNGEEGLQAAMHKHYDLFVLDIMLPGMDGYELLEYLRPTGTPVIFITAKGSLGDRVKGLRLGADDYIVKPFEIAELVARVESVLRRTGRGGRMLRAWDVQLDALARTVTKAGEPVGLTPREFDLLEQLLRNRGAALYRDALFERVWGGEMDPDTRTLDLHINRLRKKLGWHDKITTVYKVGYKLEKEEAGP